MRGLHELIRESLHLMTASLVLVLWAFDDAALAVKVGESATSRPAGSPEHINRWTLTPAWRKKLACGPNSVYVMLKLHRIDCNVESPDAYIPTHSEGMSLSEICTALTNAGCPAEVRKYSLADLLNHSTGPLIAAIDFMEGKHHYVVVFDASSRGFRAIDATCGRALYYPIEDFQSRWSGFVVVRQTSPALVDGCLAVATILFWLLVGYRLWR